MSRLARSPLLASALLLNSLWPPGHASVQGSLSPASPNVLLLVADDLGIDKLGVYATSPSAPPTPHLDALAQHGVRFTTAWANPACSATRAALLTGRYGFRTGVGYVEGPDCPDLALAETTLPERLELDAAFRGTHALIGKWHLGTQTIGGLNAPLLAGFGHYAGILGNLGLESYSAWSKVEDGLASAGTNYITTDQVDEALEWIGVQPAAWFCQVSFSAAHAPYSAPPAHLHTQPLPAAQPHGDAGPYYDATVEALDNEIGRLLSALAPAVLANTVVIFAADNGTPPEAVEAPFDPAKAKLTLYEGGLRVPLLISGPLVVQPGRTVPHVVHVIDLYSTIALILAPQSAPQTTGLDSISLLPYLQQPQAPTQRQSIYSELFKHNASGISGWSQALRNSRYKLIRHNASGKDEFYDLNSDPLETNNLLKQNLSAEQKRQYRKLVLQLSGLLTTH
jgi:arylsulfatase A-like enzyme